MRSTIAAFVTLAVAGCGAAGPPVRSSAAASSESASREVAAPLPDIRRPAPAWPTAREVLIDGVRSARLLDEVGGFRLVGGAGTIALVGPDGHVRASHRFAFGADGASAVFLTPTPGDPSHAVVGNGDHDGFRGPWSGSLHRWNLDEDTMEQLVGLGYSAPLLARVGTAVVAVDESQEALFGVAGSGEIERREETASRLGWAPGRPAECYVGNEDQSWLVRAAPDGSLVLTADDADTPETPPSAPIPDTWPLTASGARGLPSIAIAPRGGRLAVGSSVSAVVLGPEGIGTEIPTSLMISWARTEALAIGPFPYPLALPTRPARSVFFDALPYPQDEESTASEPSAFAEWRYRAEEAERDGQPVPALPLEPVCNSSGARRCVRARIERMDLAGWELFDPARPARVLATIEQREFPPGNAYVFVAPGGRFLRVFGGDVTSILTMPRGRQWTELEAWVELDAGWVFVDPAQESSLTYVPYDGGRVVTREIPGLERARLAIVDGTHVLLDTGGEAAEVLAVPSLATERTVALGAAAVALRCHEGGLVRQDDEGTVEGRCPVEALDYDQGYAVTLSEDRAFWVDGRLGEVARVHRSADGAEIQVRLAADGVLVTGPGGVFEGRGEVLDHLVVREPGPVRSAAITTGAEARARFERPGLVAAFFAGRPLPQP